MWVMAPALVPPVIPPGGLGHLRQATLVVGDLVIRPWTEGDAPAVEAVYRDPGIQRWHARSMTAAESVGWILQQNRQWSEGTGAGWAVTSDDVLVGRVGFRVLDLEEGYAETAYWVVPLARGRGIAARSLSAVSAWMFDEVGFQRLALLHSTQNPASCRVAQKAGYVAEGTARGAGLHADGWHDMHVHAWLRTDRARQE
ncbi:MAG: hypothetical protein JWR85_2683 [Marmoricola sp.]|nr:hypothetical protein [Marmoricola sp.]